MNVVLLSLTFYTPVGTLNEKRKATLCDAFKEDYPMAGEVSPFGFFSLFNNGISERIVFSESDFSLIFESQTLNPDFSKVKTTVKKVFDILLLDHSKKGIFKAVGSISSQKNTMEFSLENFVSDQSKIFADSIKAMGVGLRFLLKKDVSIWEFKIEPKVDNNSSFYTELNANLNSSDLDDLLRKMEETFVDFRINYNELLKTSGTIPNEE